MRKKLANGYGTVTRLSGNRRNPYSVREGKTGKQVLLCCVATYEEGLEYLADYNRKLLLEMNKKFIFQEVWDLLIEKKSNRLGDATMQSLKAAYQHCSSLIDFDYCDIKVSDMQDCIDHCGRGYATQNAIKNLFYHLDRVALEFEISDKNFSDYPLHSDP